MRFPLLIALSHLRSRRHEAGVSAITLISIMGVTVGVMALIMVLAVMEGFEIDLRDKILGSNAHLVVLQYGGNFGDFERITQEVTDTPGIRAAAPFVYTEVMLRAKFGTAGAILKGIDPNRTGDVTDFVSNLTMGPSGELQTKQAKIDLVSQISDPPRAVGQSADDNESLPGIIVGTELADQLNVFVGDQLHVINPVGGGTGPLGTPVPHVKPFRVAGVFHSGMYEYDTKWTYVAIPDAQAFLKVGATVTGIEASALDMDHVEDISELVQEKLSYPFYVRHWKDLNRNLFSALKLEKIVMGLILSLIVMVASLNIVGSLILVVVTRAREISILRAMGASSGAIRQIFVLEGVIIGVVGTLIGSVMGLLGCEALKRYEFPLDTDVYYLDTLPVVVEPHTVLLVAVSAIAIGFVATLYPATVAARIKPVDGLRYE